MRVNVWQQEQHWMKVWQICYELRMLGAPIDGPMWLFGDNKSMIESASEPLGRLQKHHLLLSWHWLQEKTAIGIVYYVHVKLA
jgi:hypothetical protein